MNELIEESNSTFMILNTLIKEKDYLSIHET